MQKKEESAASHNTGVSDAKGKSCRRETIIHVCYTIQQRPDHFLNKTWQKKKKKKCSISGCWSSQNETNPAKKAAGKKQFYSESRKVLTRSSLKQRDRLHPYIPAQWTRRKKTRYRRSSIRVWGFRFWRLAKNKGWVLLLLLFETANGCLQLWVVVVVSCNTHRRRAASSPSLLCFCWLGFCCNAALCEWVCVCLFSFHSSSCDLLLLSIAVSSTFRLSVFLSTVNTTRDTMHELWTFAGIKHAKLLWRRCRNFLLWFCVSLKWMRMGGVEDNSRGVRFQHPPPVVSSIRGMLLLLLFGSNPMFQSQFMTHLCQEWSSDAPLKPTRSAWHGSSLDCQSGTRTRCERDTHALRTYVLFSFLLCGSSSMCTTRTLEVVLRKTLW